MASVPVDAQQDASKPQPTKTAKVISLAPNSERGSSIDGRSTAVEPVDKAWFEKLKTDPVATFTALLFIVTAGLVYVGLRQDKTTREVQRAFVFVKKPESRVTITPNGEFVSMGFWVKWENSGTTPTNTMFANVNVTWVKEEKDFAYGMSGNEEKKTPLVLGPRCEIGAAPPKDQLGAEYVVDAWSGKSHIFIWGACEYADIFGAHHVTEYCFKLRVSGNLEGVASGNFLFTYDLYGDHNRHYDAKKIQTT